MVVSCFQSIYHFNVKSYSFFFSLNQEGQLQKVHLWKKITEIELKYEFKLTKASKIRKLNRQRLNSFFLT